jgi:hypothetical protein
VTDTGVVPGLFDRRGEMENVPIRYTSRHRIKFSDLDPYNHLRTGAYATSTWIIEWRECESTLVGG